VCSYILDEPSIGLHQRDNARLLATLRELRDLGNTVLVVEHDEETIRSADYVVDLGRAPVATAARSWPRARSKEVLRHRDSLTARYLRGEAADPCSPATAHRERRFVCCASSARANHNLKISPSSFPLGLFVAVTGVSGSGKSTLVTTFCISRWRAISIAPKVVPERMSASRGSTTSTRSSTSIKSPIGRTPRSNPATYTGLFTPIRELFTYLPESKLRGYGPGRFSFNVKGGRCEACQGDGLVKVEMHARNQQCDRKDPDRCSRCHSRSWTLSKLPSQVLNLSGFRILGLSFSPQATKEGLQRADDASLSGLRKSRKSPQADPSIKYKTAMPRTTAEASAGTAWLVVKSCSVHSRYSLTSKAIRKLRSPVAKARWHPPPSDVKSPAHEGMA